MPNLFRPAGRANLAQQTTAFLAATLAAASAASDVGASEIKVYTVTSIPVTTPFEATIVHLDAAEMIEAGLSAGLPHIPANAADPARQRLQDGGAKLQRDLAAAYEDIAEAWSVGITTLPAVVVDGRYVVYGESDVAKAVAKIQAFRKAQP